MGNVELHRVGEAQGGPSPRPRTVPSDWFLDPADPEAAERYEAGRSLEDMATALLDAAPQPLAEVTPIRGLSAEVLRDAGLEDEDLPMEAPAKVWLPLPGFPGAEDEGELGWQTEALCAQTDPEAFFPEKGGSTRDAKKVCASCTVRTECLEYALANDERFGIWGGMSERERRRLRKRAN